MQGILLQSGYFERELSKRFKKVNFILLSNRMSSVCYSHAPVCHAYVTRMYSFVIRMALVCHSYVIICHLYVTRMSSVYHSHVLVCHPYVTHMYSMTFLGHWYVVLPWIVSQRTFLHDGFWQTKIYKIDKNFNASLTKVLIRNLCSYHRIF